MTRKFNPRSPKRSLSQQDTSDNTSIPPGGPPGFHPSPYRASPSRRALSQHPTPPNATPASAYIYRTPQFSSVHQRNLYLASRPLVFVFDAFGVAIYQLFSILRTFLLLFWRPVSSYWRNRKEKCRASSESEVTIMSSGGRNVAHATSMRGGPGLTDPLLAQQKKHHRKAYEYISKALRIDEDSSASSKDIAVELYKRGIAELEKGIEIHCHGTGDQWEHAQRIQEKMIVNLSMAKERLEYLSK
ncbi:unnamed protein product [Orchesella dallaii]|uniref:MIT domain-containing protein n=1 Tax=Orchesella dallaii TaxID=48710 RepID=A0ABP1RZH7_9HEXA